MRVLPRDGDRGDPARLGDGDRTGTGVPPTVQDLGELRALPGARLADDHNHRVLRHGLRYLVLELEDGEDRHGSGETVEDGSDAGGVRVWGVWVCLIDLAPHNQHIFFLLIYKDVNGTL